MFEILNSFELTNVEWVLILCCALMIGVTKAGVAGLELTGSNLHFIISLFVFHANRCV